MNKEKRYYFRPLPWLKLCSSLSGSLLLLLLSSSSAWSNEAASPESPATSIAATQDEGSIDWVTDSLVWLDQAVVAQATLQTIGVQDNSLVLSSSTDSADLQPVESVPAVEDVIQAHLIRPSYIAQATPAQTQSEQWHFLLVPYVYVPFFISGSATYEGSEEFQNNFWPETSTIRGTLMVPEILSLFLPRFERRSQIA
jgi:hypothetical protein